MHAAFLRSAELLVDRPTVILYGAGSVGRDVHAFLQQEGWTIRCILDRRAEPGAYCDATPVYLPGNNPLTSAERAAFPVIISIFNRDTDVPEVARTLAGLGYATCVSFVDLHNRFAMEMGDRFWLTRRSFYDEHADVIAETAALWADDASRELYDALLSFRRTGEYAVLPRPSGGQYFPRDIPGWPPTPLRLVDCGAYDGDTLAELMETGLPVEAIAAFEPDLASFSRLAAWAHKHAPMLSSDLALWPCGVAGRTDLFTFSAGQGEGSALAVGGVTTIPCVALDEALPGFRPNLIKMDIEGAEPDALQGAERLVRRHRPALAICVYHRPGHLWEIPHQIATWCLGYRFYLRAHAHNGFEVVLYALPISDWESAVLRHGSEEAL